MFDKQGGFWFTDHGCGTPEGRKHGALYYAKPDGSSIIRARDHLISPNGVGLSPDEKVVYVADTQLGRLWAFDVDRPGRAGAAGRLRAGPGDLQPARLSSCSTAWRWRPAARSAWPPSSTAAITAFDPDGSTEHFPFPDLITTNICFGGADMRDAWVTCSSTGKLYKCRWPRPGLKLNLQRLRTL